MGRMTRDPHCIVPHCHDFAYGNQAVCLRHLAYEMGALLLLVGTVWCLAIALFLKVRDL